MKQNTKRIQAKGTSRRVVIVRCDQDSVFEQIIYVVRDDCLSGKGISADHVLREAIQTVQSDWTEEDAGEPSAIYSRVILALVIIAFLLTIGILAYLYFHGWS